MDASNHPTDHLPVFEREIPTDRWWRIIDGDKNFRLPCHLPNIKCGTCGFYFLKWF